MHQVLSFPVSKGSAVCSIEVENLSVAFFGDFPAAIKLPAAGFLLQNEIDYSGQGVRAITAEAPPVNISTLSIKPTGIKLRSTVPPSGNVGTNLLLFIRTRVRFSLTLSN